jgi:hypothetical protein
VHLRLGRGQARQQPAQTQRLLAQGRAHPIVAGRRRIPLVEDQIDDLQYGRQPLGRLGRRRQLDRDPALGQGALGPGDPFADGGLRNQIGAGDLVGAQPAQQAQGERGPRLRRQHRVTCGEDQPEQVVADVVVEVGGDVRVDARRHGAADLRQLLPVGALPAQQVDGAMLGRGDQPGRGMLRDPLGRPLLQGDDHGVLGQFLGQPDVADDPGQRGDDARRLEPPHGRQRTARIGTSHGPDPRRLTPGELMPERRNPPGP